jgi:hypothetical protein
MNYKKLVPPDSFIGQYLTYMDVVETAQVYDFWCALWAIGVGIGRDVYVDRPNAPVFGNWYIILAADSGVTRKSTAINSIRSIVDRDHAILAGKTSPEALELYLHERSRENGIAQANFAVEELVTILGREGYMSTMPGLLTDLYGCPAERKSPGTLKTGEIIQRNVYVNFISASTPSWLVTAINPSVIEGGFTSRVIFIVDEERKRAIAWPTSRQHESLITLGDSYNNLIFKAKRIKTITISPNALSKFTKWYNSRTTHNDSFRSSFEAREDDHILRLSMCLAINDGTLELQSRHVGTAIKVIASVKDSATKLFGGTYSDDIRYREAIERIRTILLEAGSDGLRHNKLQQRVARRLDAQELRLLMDIMHECSMIQIFEVKRGRFYRATKGIEKFGVVSDVIERLAPRG